MPNSVGWGASGPTNGESAKGYTQRDGGYDDCIMRIAQSMVNPDHYQLTWLGAKTKCNCQDYADALRAKYREIKDDPEVNASVRKESKHGSIIRFSFAIGCSYMAYIDTICRCCMLLAFISHAGMVLPETQKRDRIVRENHVRHCAGFLRLHDFQHL